MQHYECLPVKTERLKHTLHWFRLDFSKKRWLYLPFLVLLFPLLLSKIETWQNSKLSRTWIVTMLRFLEHHRGFFDTQTLNPKKLGLYVKFKLKQDAIIRKKTNIFTKCSWVDAVISFYAIMCLTTWWTSPHHCWWTTEGCFPGFPVHTQKFGK